jgi:hypothetical protein
MTISELQKYVGATPDGFWGPKSIAACQRHLRRLMPANNPWPSSDESSLIRFYGEPGDEDNLVSISLGGRWVVRTERGAKQVQTTRCHRLVADSLTRVFTELVRQGWNKTLDYDGCFNDRLMRGGTRKSTHAWGIAVDIDASNNGNLIHWPTRATMPIQVMEVFAREGWMSAGAFWSRDAMHFQCTK